MKFLGPDGWWWDDGHISPFFGQRSIELWQRLHRDGWSNGDAVKATTSTVNHSFLASHWVVAIYLQWMALLPMWWPGFLNGKTLGVRWCETGRELLFSERLVYLRSLKITSSVPRAWDFFRGWDELGGRGACDGVATLFSPRALALKSWNRR